MNITKPTLILDEKKFKSNVEKMISKARKNGVVFRPHFKTHQSLKLSEYFKERGVEKITVSSVSMAEYFASGGWKDITIAFPFNNLETEKVINLIDNGVKINLLVESLETMAHIIRFIKKKCDIYIKIDTGNRRTGLLPEDTDYIGELSALCENSHHDFSGFLVHSGNTYHTSGFDEICEINQFTLETLNRLREKFGTGETIISIGDTPTCSLSDNFSGADEIRPGNFVFYDLMQAQIGSCTFDQIAVSVACPVVAKHYDRNEIIIYGGAVHLSKDYIMYEGEKCYGFLTNYNDDLSWDTPLAYTFIRSLSQEHGIIKTTRNVLDHTKVGDIVGIIPVHSCLTVDNFDRYTDTNSNEISKMRSL